jgi:hypothetical protein
MVSSGRRLGFEKPVSHLFFAAMSPCSAKNHSSQPIHHGHPTTIHRSRSAIATWIDPGYCDLICILGFSPDPMETANPTHSIQKSIKKYH